MGEPITEKIHQLITITGARGTGKSILAATHAIKDAGADKGKIDADNQKPNTDKKTNDKRNHQLSF